MAIRSLFQIKDYTNILLDFFNTVIGQIPDLFYQSLVINGAHLIY